MWPTHPPIHMFARCVGVWKLGGRVTGRFAGRVCARRARASPESHLCIIDAANVRRGNIDSAARFADDVFFCAPAFSTHRFVRRGKPA